MTTELRRFRGFEINSHAVSVLEAAPSGLWQLIGGTSSGRWEHPLFKAADLGSRYNIIVRAHRFLASSLISPK
jgi:hypothetical protein